MSIAVLCILIAVLLPPVTMGLSKFSSVGSYDNAKPRDWAATQTGWRLRAYWAQNNHFEALPGFAAAVILCLIAGVDRSWLDQWAMIFIAIRLVYTAIYLAGIAPLRTLVWLGGSAVVIWMFIKAATALAAVAPV